jgi:glycosyltransferase involved in cell wall biosynthesis
MSVKVSFLIPFYNPGDRIIDCIESVLSQQGPEFEVILVDNGSDDGSFEEVGRRYRLHHRIRVAHEPRRGIAFALNTGLKWCAGAYIARMDADDICMPGRMEAQATLLDDDPSIGLVSGLVHHIGSEETEGMAHYVAQINQWVTAEDIRKNRFVESPVAHPSVMFRKDLIAQYGSYSTDAVPEDYELWLRWLDAGVQMQKVEIPVLEWHDLPERLSRNHEHYAREGFEQVRVQYLSRWLRKNVRPDKPIFIWGGGKYSVQKAKMLEQLGIRVHGFIDVTDKTIVADKPVIHYSKIPPPGLIFILSAVSNRGKFEEIRNHLLSLGHHEELDFLLAS